MYVYIYIYIYNIYTHTHTHKYFKYSNSTIPNTSNPCKQSANSYKETF